MSEDQATELIKSMQNFRSEVKESMQDFRTEVKDSIQDFRTEMNARFDKTATQEQFTRLFKYTQEIRTEMNNRFNETAPKDSFDRLQNTIDNFVRRLDDSEIEQSSRDLQFDRLLSWARHVSKKTGIPLVDL